ncbi:MAG: energy transducer TonB [Steroidobacteraceae bacterium]
MRCYRRRLPWLAAAVVPHATLIALFLMPARVPVPNISGTPIEIQIINKPRVVAAPPPPKPLGFVPPTAPIVVPAPLVSIPEPASIAAAPPRATQAAMPVAVVSRASPAPPARLAPPRFDAAYLHNPPPDYPLEARRLREHGTVLLRVEVSAQGRAVEIKIEHSSGWSALDASALDAVKRWRFEPARRGSEPVAAWVLVPIEFGLHA